MNREEYIQLVGRTPNKPKSLDVQTVEIVDCGSYNRHKISYLVEQDDRVSAYVCIPKNTTGKVPGIFCHHQHNGQFNLGKSEVVGLAGDPEQAYAAELAARGYVTFAVDALAFEDRNWHDEPFLAEIYEATARISQGTTFIAKLLHDISVSIDVLCGVGEVDAARVGFIGHSYGGKMAFWAAAYDHRIRAAVSNCGSTSIKRSLEKDAGVLPELTIPRLLNYGDISDIAKLSEAKYLISVTTDDVWSLDAEEMNSALDERIVGSSELAIYEGEHMFSTDMREHAYDFFNKHLMVN